MLTLFANLAVASSFLGVTLGLFDYLADLFGFDESRQGRLKTAAVTFIPPTILGILFPNGFLIAIGFAALAATIWAAIVPAMMAYKSRKIFADSEGFRVPGGTPLIAVVIVFGIVTGACHLARYGWDFTRLRFKYVFSRRLKKKPLKEAFCFLGFLNTVWVFADESGQKSD